jgi:hypothetical protein
LIAWKASLNDATEHRLEAYATLGRRVVTQVHGEGSRDSSERSLDRPGSQCSIGILPVFFRTIERRFRDSSKSLSPLHQGGSFIFKIPRVETLG